MTQQWWRDAVVYQVYPRSFADANGDGMGDLQGVINKLDYLQQLGVDAIWLSPFYVSPQNDAGYDVADYCDVDPRFGTLEDADRLIAAANARDIKVIIDMVPNHSSSEHPFFQAALQAGPGSPERDMYMFRDGKGANGELPPNNWQSIFHGAGWTRVKEADGSLGQWYLHIFDTTQPDWNWENPKVHEFFQQVLRFWLDRGVAGMRIDVAHGMIKAPGLPDAEVNAQGLIEINDEYVPPYFDQDGVHEIYREWRKIFDEYEGDRVMVGECWAPPARLPLYMRSDEMHQAFNFSFLMARWDEKMLKDAILKPMELSRSVNGSDTWVLSNHDVIRHATRYGFGPDYQFGEGLSRTEASECDLATGLLRARATSLLMLALPGSAYLYQGEELGLFEVAEIPDELREDPAHKRAGVPGRDGCRVPMPWQKDAPGYGFSDVENPETPWLPQPTGFAELSADQQVGIPGSTFEMYRSAIALRKHYGLGHADLKVLPDHAPGVLTLQVGPVLVLVNTSAAEVSLASLQAEGYELLLGSNLNVNANTLPEDSAVWLVR